MQEAYARRGAPWTFDADAFVMCVRAARDNPHVAVPSFDHGVGDPVEGDLAILPHHRCVGGAPGDPAHHHHHRCVRQCGGCGV